jgi:hypothetical protein
MARALTTQEIDAVIAVLRSKEDHDFIARGRGGSGFGHRRGQLYAIYVEDFEREEFPLTENELRERLARIDLDDYSQRYDIWAIQQMGIPVEGPTFVSR